MKVTDSVLFEMPDGILEGSDVAVSEKRLKDAAFFENKEGVDPETLLYTVYSHGDGKGLNWGLSVLEPVKVNGQYNMTRGHFHENLDAQEYYWVLGGRGYLLLMDEAGNTWAEVCKPGSLHRIDGHHAHRLINTGDEQLRVACCWPANAGHDYGRVERMPFGDLCMEKEGETVWVTTSSRQ